MKRKQQNIEKRISPRIMNDAIKFISQYFPSLNNGAEYIANSVPILANKTLKELKGTFTKNELKFLVTVMEEANLTPKNTNNLYGVVIDALDAYTIHKTLKLDRDTILEKLTNLSLLQSFTLEIFLYGYWYGEEKPTDMTIDQYIKAIE